VIIMSIFQYFGQPIPKFKYSQQVRTRHPSKRDDRRTITIRALPGTLDEGAVLRGVYKHYPRRTSFGIVLDNGHEAVFMRDEWEVITSGG